VNLDIIDQYGLPIAGVIALAFALWKTVNFVQKQLLQQIEERHNAEMEAIRQLEEEHKTFHTIIVSLIDNSKLNQSNLESMKSSLDTLLKFINRNGKG
tara:strand:- start:47 stop:340 length:294 start_codon:yes stop_codon:yes gene_type:complete